ncbi:MAG: hypothetical protein M0C28_49160 [Candidatus Moduliflexus flocculans]|nr:hypothetical protein [Candidatus Moduliflexus flocculans]
MNVHIKAFAAFAFAGPRPLRLRGLGAADLRKLYDPIIKKVAGKYRIDPELVHVVIRAESNYDAFAISSAKGPWA